MIDEEFVNTIRNAENLDHPRSPVEWDCTGDVLTVRDLIEAISKLHLQTETMERHRVLIADGMPITVEEVLVHDEPGGDEAVHGVPIERVTGMTPEYVLIVDPSTIRLDGTPEWGDDVAVVSNYDTSIAFQ